MCGGATGSEWWHCLLDICSSASPSSHLPHILVGQRRRAQGREVERGVWLVFVGEGAGGGSADKAGSTTWPLPEWRLHKVKQRVGSNHCSHCLHKPTACLRCNSEQVRPAAQSSARQEALPALPPPLPLPPSRLQTIGTAEVDSLPESS